MTNENTRNRLWAVLEPAEDNDWASKLFDISISLLIVLSIIAVVLESISAVKKHYSIWFDYFEYFCLTAFTIEYCCRLWSCASSEKYSGKYGRLRWMFSFMAIVDLVSILPGILMLGGLDLRFIRAVRLLRLLRLGRYNRGMKLIGAMFARCKGQLLVALSCILVLLLIASSALYYAENDAQPEAFSSIPTAMWWGVCTLTTVGYGDVYPITTLGKLLSSIISILGIGAFALPAGIIAANFEKSLDEEKLQKCPHCGHRF